MDPLWAVCEAWAAREQPLRAAGPDPGRPPCLNGPGVHVELGWSAPVFWHMASAVVRQVPWANLVLTEQSAGMGSPDAEMLIISKSASTIEHGSRTSAVPR